MGAAPMYRHLYIVVAGECAHARFGHRRHGLHRPCSGETCRRRYHLGAGDEMTVDVFVLIHSPLVGPLTWSLVAKELRQRGIDTMVPVLHDIEGSDVPYWRQHADAA